MQQINGKNIRVISGWDSVRVNIGGNFECGMLNDGGKFIVYGSWFMGDAGC
jgi:hypothetical protein